MERTVKGCTIAPDLGSTGVGREPSVGRPAEADAGAGACAIDRQIRRIIHREDHSLRGPVHSECVKSLREKLIKQIAILNGKNTA